MADPRQSRFATGSPLAGNGTGDGSSPARGAEMRDFLKTKLLQRNRAPPLVHNWDFWHDRQERAQNGQGGKGSDKYEDRLVCLASVDDVKAFWNVFNNFDITKLPLRDSVHLFHRGVKPVWEDRRNEKGGAWTFRVPKDKAPDFWKEMCMMAIGEQLQEAVESDRSTFRDDICGISLSVRFNSYLVQVWNRDANHAQAIHKILVTVNQSMSNGLAPSEGSYYYKKHSEHAGFAGSKDLGDKGVERSVSETKVSRDDDQKASLDYMADVNRQMKAGMDDIQEKHGLDE